jgi:hypothetical protein
MSALKVMPWPDLMADFSAASVNSNAFVAISQGQYEYSFERQSRIQGDDEHTWVFDVVSSLAQDLKWASEVESVETLVEDKENLDGLSLVLGVCNCTHCIGIEVGVCVWGILEDVVDYCAKWKMATRRTNDQSRAFVSAARPAREQLSFHSPDRDRTALPRFWMERVGPG